VTTTAERIRIAVAALALVAAPAARAGEVWWFKDRPYLTPALADPRAAILKIAFPAWSRAVPQAVSSRSGTVWDITMGKELPLGGWQSNSLSDEWVDRGEWGAGLWLPVGFHMIEDLGKDRSNPILNVDYRFGLAAKLQVGLPWTPPGRFTGTVLGAQVYVGHESTHIGDEFTINGIEAYGDAFRRINVSYQCVEGALQLGLRFETWRARLQARYLHIAFTGGDSWYGEKLEFPLGATVTPSKRNYEPAFAVELSREHPLLWTILSRPFVSVDLRPRTIYGYDRPDASMSEDVQWSVNAIAGVRPDSTRFGGFTHFYVRGYYGVNPAGQFRSQRDYWVAGFGFAFFHEDK
jgi:hypothetical protein